MGRESQGGGWRRLLRLDRPVPREKKATRFLRVREMVFTPQGVRSALITILNRSREAPKGKEQTRLFSSNPVYISTKTVLRPRKVRLLTEPITGTFFGPLKDSGLLRLAGSPHFYHCPPPKNQRCLGSILSLLTEPPASREGGSPGEAERRNCPKNHRALPRNEFGS